MDQGIIRNFKVIYRKLFLTALVADTISKKLPNVNDINVLNAVTWIFTAW